MPNPDALEQLNGEISAMAAHIARHRDLIEQMRAEGKTTAAAELALQSLSELYRRRLQFRQSLETSDAVAPDQHPI